MAYRCRECGYQSPKWLGRCPQCGRWESFDEVGAPAGGGGSGEPPRSLSEVPALSPERLATGLPEVDRVLGGLLPGTVVLFGGEPGVGKSTLLLQLAARLAARHGKVLYVSGEEAVAQVKLRAERLGISEPSLYLQSEQELLAIVRAVEEIEPTVLVVDSLQTVLARPDGGEIGSLTQVREAAAHLARLAKGLGMVTFLVSHITKGGEFAGPKTVEHLVDVALQLEGVREGDLRLLRCLKNRFGSTAEVAVLQMGPTGLSEVANPSLFFVSQDRAPKPGAAIVPVLEGSRTLLVEIQALIAPGSGFGPPQRRTAGLDVNRTSVLLAVIEKYLGVHVRAMDVYLAVAGGLEVREPAADLGVCAAILGSLRGRAIPPDTVVLGEVGLAGEIRPVRKGPERLQEVAKLGFARAVAPPGPLPKRLPLTVVQARTLQEAMEALELT
ncbi:MAG TPA: DNA repair protein RadA [Candidatus Bipolaricaulis anaerobius]|nr:DNA repair protein RadA [Candidatus Bipolaricaulis anaerobius]HNS24319.1 DNA repair protein RadA [Candidatus Bipolaricaulis anaerobius]HOD73597.1 DNA repair protein RadA [Candidatus Bipolaricaulis anaerobius]HQM37873.1 DNA repair protein RadA [Candidatus Bipolaricaulis anaerobius]